MFAEETYTGKSDSIEKIKEKFWTKNRHPHVGGISMTAAGVLIFRRKKH